MPSTDPDVQRARTKRLRECGLCWECGQAPAWKPDKVCVTCRDKRRARLPQGKGREAALNERNRRNRARVELRKADGVCTRCADGPAVEPGGTCAECRAKGRTRAARRRAALGQAPDSSHMEDQSEYTSSSRARAREFKRTHPERRCGRCSKRFQPTASRRITCYTCFLKDHEVSVKLMDRWAS